MNFRHYNSLMLDTVLYILAGLLFGYLIVNSIYAAFILGFALCGLFVCSNDPLKALCLFLFVIPFSETSLVGTHLISIPGAKPLQLLALLVLFSAIINHKESSTMPHYALVFTIVFLAMFSVSILRSLPHLDTLNYIKEQDITPTKFLLSTLLKPLIYFLPFIVIIKYCKTMKDCEVIMNMLALSVLGLSVYLLYLYVFHIGHREAVREASTYYVSVFNIHRNGLANFYILCFPIFLARCFMRKDLISILSLCITISAVAVLYSRTAYAMVLLSFIVYPFVSKRTKVIPLVVAVFFGVIWFIPSRMIPSPVIERASLGLDSGDRADISAGRIDDIWLPLIDEYAHSPTKLLFGNGRFGISTSEAVKRGTARQTGHAHNMYLEQILDTGMSGLIIVVTFFIILFVKLYRHLSTAMHSRIHEYQFAVSVSLILFFIAGITGRSFFPQENNIYFWTMVGLAVAMIHMGHNSGQYAATQSPMPAMQPAL